ncbi:hypothetical protein NQ314_019449 [Rhamnusium bicolor]|uniref:Uncharacterized protein n=1 Tax=Rhamnusium bicolor TaxID=1586634 RepID=A0AAV8WN73_9CUCU|nr:hypothetical protein NQ314_019449 [Rhamnusium bicolor]
MKMSKIKDSKEKLAVIYPGIKQITTNMKLNFSESEDIYLFRIPKNVDPHLLENTEIDLDEECKINIGEKYSIKPTTKIPDPTLVISDNCKVIHFKRNIKMEKI